MIRISNPVAVIFLRATSVSESPVAKNDSDIAMHESTSRIHKNKGVVVQRSDSSLLAEFMSADQAMAAISQISSLKEMTDHDLTIKIALSYGKPLIEDGKPGGMTIEGVVSLHKELNDTGIIADGNFMTALQTKEFNFESHQAANGETIYLLIPEKTFDQTHRYRETLIPSELKKKIESDDEGMVFESDDTAEVTRADRCLELFNHGLTARITPDMHTFTIGRSADNDMVVPDNHVSRHHVTIERHGNDFILINHSPNGACIQEQHKNSILVDGQIKIPGACSIGLGPDIQQSGQNVIKVSIV